MMTISLLNSSTLRQLWSVVEETQSNTLLRLDDADLVKQLIGKVDSQKSLSSEESNTLMAYIYSRTTLIRDLAQARLA